MGSLLTVIEFICNMWTVYLNRPRCLFSCSPVDDVALPPNIPSPSLEEQLPGLSESVPSESNTGRYFASSDMGRGIFVWDVKARRYVAKTSVATGPTAPRKVGGFSVALDGACNKWPGGADMGCTGGWAAIARNHLLRLLMDIRRLWFTISSLSVQISREN